MVPPGDNFPSRLPKKLLLKPRVVDASGPTSGAGQRDGQRGGTPRRAARDANVDGRHGRHGPSGGEAGIPQLSLEFP